VVDAVLADELRPTLRVGLIDANGADGIGSPNPDFVSFLNW
jgi:hypothetical protein